MRQNWYTYSKVAYALLLRDLHLIRSQLFGRLVDGVIVVTVQVIGIGYFLPYLGMPKTLVGPLYIGIASQLCIASGYTLARRAVFDLKNNRTIDYHLLLPLPLTVLLLEYTISLMIELISISLPLIIFGTILLGNMFPLEHAHIVAIGISYLLMILFYALFFTYLGYGYEYTWFMDNVWARRLSPLFLFGASFYTWKRAYAFSPLIANIFLINPLVYIHEGLRGAFFAPASDFLPWWLCTGVSVFVCIALVFFIKRAVTQQLDPV